jgi:hypothetical protein
MNVAMRLTLDGLVQALRWKAHALAEDAEQGYRPDVRDALDADAIPAPEPRSRRMREQRDDRPGR